MIYTEFSAGGEKLSQLGMGCMRFPTNPDGTIDREKAQQMIDQAIKSGINYFDTAYVYHEQQSEGLLGEALSKYPRDSYFLADKLPFWILKTPEDVKRIFEEQLARLKTDYIDFYLVHDMSASNFEVFQKTNAYDYLTKMKQEGKIKHLGFSCHDTPEALSHYLDAYKWEFCLLQINYVDWHIDLAQKQYNEVRKRGLPVMIMEPVRGGFLAQLPPKVSRHLEEVNPNRSQAGWALKWCRQLEGVKVVLSGMSAMEQLEDNIKTFSEDTATLSDDEMQALKNAVDELSKIQTIPCTGCRYCMDCPSGVDIPRIFAIYNKLMLLGGEVMAYRNYSQFMPEKNRATSCVACGACEAACPQGIKIINELKMIDSKLSIMP